MRNSRRIKAIAASLLLAGSASIAGASAASATACGFTGLTSSHLGGGDDGKYEEGTYLNCDKSKQKIRVNYFYASEERCVSPGETHLSANPNLGALVGADKIGKC